MKHYYYNYKHIFIMCHCSDYLGRIYTDSLVHDEKALQLLIDIVGEVRLYNIYYHSYMSDYYYLLRTM